MRAVFSITVRRLVGNAPSMPRVVLMQTSYSGNIGSSCRAMANTGFCDLRVVHPAEAGWRHCMDAVHFARAGLPILDAAKEHADLISAVGDVHFLVGTGFTKQFNEDIVPAHIPADEAMRLCVDRIATGQKVAILFGNERDGLPRDAMALCDVVCSVPYLSAGADSLNLAHAVLLVTFLFAQASAAAANGAVGTTVRLPPMDAAPAHATDTATAMIENPPLPQLSIAPQRAAAADAPFDEAAPTPAPTPKPTAPTPAPHASRAPRAPLPVPRGAPRPRRAAARPATAQQRSHFVLWLRDALVAGGMRGTTAHDTAMRLLRMTIRGSATSRAPPTPTAGDVPLPDAPADPAQPLPPGEWVAESDIQLLYSVLRVTGAGAAAGAGPSAEETVPFGAPRAAWTARRSAAPVPETDRVIMHSAKPPE